MMVKAKAGTDVTLKANHRSISLLSNLSNIVKRIILCRRRDEMAKITLIPDEQFRFKAVVSTDYQLLRKKK